MQPSTIAIVGVGRLGGGLAKELIRADVYSKLYLINRSQRRLDSTTLSLRVYGSYVGSKTQVEPLSDRIPLNTNTIVLTVKENYDPRVLLERERLPQEFQRNVRTIGIKRDLPLVREVCRMLTGYTGRIIVLTNPVDIFTVLVKEWVPTAEVLGLGVTMDAARLAFCAQQHGIKCTCWDCALGGVHIGKLVQLRSLWNKQSPFFSQTELAIDDLMHSSAKIGPEIVRGLGYTLHDCVEVFSRDLIWLLQQDKARNYLCASIGDDSTAVAWPLSVSPESGRCVPIKTLTDSELRQLGTASDLVQLAVNMVRTKSFSGYGAAP